MKMQSFRTSRLELNSVSAKRKVSGMDTNGNSIEFDVIFNISQVSSNFRDDIYTITQEKINNLIDSAETLRGKYEIELSDKDFY